MITALLLSAADHSSYIQRCADSQQYGCTDHPGMGGVQHGGYIRQPGNLVIVNELAQKCTAAANTAQGAADQAATDPDAVEGKYNGGDPQKKTQDIHGKTPFQNRENIPFNEKLPVIRSGVFCSITSAASIPSISPFNFISIKTTSGIVSAAVSIASCPVSTVSITSYPNSSNNFLKK